MTIRVVIADDHDIVRQGLKLYLQFDPEFEVVGEAANGLEALELVEQLRPDIVLMDILMPEMDGLEATVAIRQRMPETEVLILTSVLDDAIVHQAIRAGAIGYLLKDTRSNVLCNAIKAAADGQVQLSKQVAIKIANESNEWAQEVTLTLRERDVLQLLTQGFSNKEIAQRLSISIKTVKSHVGNLLSKLGVNSRTQATLYAIKSGLAKID